MAKVSQFKARCPHCHAFNQDETTITIDGEIIYYHDTYWQKGKIICYECKEKFYVEIILLVDITKTWKPHQYYTSDRGYEKRND